MKRSTPTRQSGYALILMVLALMGVGGIVIAGYTQEAKTDTEHQRYLHNERMLREAKQALLQYAYNYPVANDLGPGRLPNADTDNDGVADGGSTFGRLPWAQQNLNLYDIRDADGQRLWYAVSSSFRPQAAVVNSDTSGTITLRDQSGNIIFDGSNAAGTRQYGIAAVIIAPGAPINQDRSVANGDDPFDYTEGDNNDVDTDPGIIDPANYLDLVAGFVKTGDSIERFHLCVVTVVTAKIGFEDFACVVEGGSGVTGGIDHAYLACGVANDIEVP